jgi:hypothetical protein
LPYCDCTGGPPWPPMMRIHTNTASRYYLCRRCGTIREDVCRPDGTIIEARFHDLEGLDLPAAVVQQAREVLNEPRYEQGSLFDSEP